MASAAHDHEFAVWPGLVQLPCGDERGTDVKATMHHDPGNTSKRTRFPE